MGSSSMGSQWVDGVGMWAGPGGLESKGVSGGSSGGMGMWDEAVKNQSGLRATSNNNMGLKNSRSSPSLRYPEPRWQNSHSNTLTLPHFAARFGRAPSHVDKLCNEWESFRLLQRAVHDATTQEDGGRRQAAEAASGHEAPGRLHHLV